MRTLLLATILPAFWLLCGCQISRNVPTLPSDFQQVYVAGKMSRPPVIDGKLDDAAWSSAPWTVAFGDIEGDTKPDPRFLTRAKMGWDDDYFYVAADMEEPHVWGTLTKRDSIIYNDNDFEVFIDPDGDNHDYYELEVNALNTQFDLILTHPYRCGGTYDIGWDIDGLKTAVDVRGTLNRSDDVDDGWSMEIAIPWESMRSHAHRPVPPNPGDQWPVNFSRVQWKHQLKADGAYERLPGVREDNWTWTPQDAIDMHRPEYWGMVEFSERSPGKGDFTPSDDVFAWTLLRRIHHAAEQYKSKHGAWPNSISTLDGLYVPIEMDDLGTPIIQGTPDEFIVKVSLDTDNGRRELQFGPDCRRTTTTMTTLDH